jgi:4-amino-4-deoxy-L-arabinose transferase-like glycosyltransferase
VRFAFAAILLIYLVLATLQSYATRLQWGPDEPAHIIYVRSLSMDLRLPALTHSEDDNAYVAGVARTHEAHHPPLYYALAGLIWRASAGLPDDRVDILDANSGKTTTHYVPGAVRVVRLLSVALGLLTLLFVWATARLVFPERPYLWLAGVALLGFTPMFTYLSGVINNDSLLALVFAAIAHRWARLLRFGASRRELCALGLLLGLGLNTKETALAFLALSLVVVAIAGGSDTWRDCLRNVLFVLALAVALGGWWTVRKLVLYGQPFVYPFDSPLMALPESQRGMYLSALPGQVFLFAFIPVDVVHRHLSLSLMLGVFGGLSGLSVSGLAVLFFRRRERNLAALIVLAGVVRNVLFIDWRMGPAGGRYLVAILPGLSLVGARGISALFGDGRLAKLALLAAVLMLLAMGILAIRATAAGYGTLWR